MKLNAAYRLSAFPQLISGQDFGFGNREDNARQMKSLLEDPNYKQIKLVGQKFGMVPLDVSETALFLDNGKYITYYVQIKRIILHGVGPSVVQTIVWRSLSGGAPVGITSKVFTYLLKKYGSIVSDKMHTDRGREFWTIQLRRAFDSGQRVGLYSNGTIVDLDTVEELEDYLDPTHFLHPWGKSESFQNFRFVIFKEKRKH